MSVTYLKLASRVQSMVKKEADLKDLTQTQIIALMRYSFYLIGDALSNGEDVYLEGFGRFHPDCKPPRKIRSWITDQEHTTDYKVFVKFTAFKQLNKQVQKFMTKIGFVAPNNEEESMLPHLLPHQKVDKDAEEAPFETVEKEIAKIFGNRHAEINDDKPPYLPTKNVEKDGK